METLGDQLIYAADKGNIERVEALLDQGVAVDSRDEEQRTPLMWASASGHTAVAALLLDRGANVNAENCVRGTPATRASAKGHLDTLQLLVSRGADIHHITHLGYSSLLEAALEDRMPVCEYLLSLGADLMAANYYNLTALSDYGDYVNYHRVISPETKALRCTVLQKAWENGPHPSQVRRRNWERRGPFLKVLAENAYLPLQARALEIASAALSLNPNEAVLISTKPKDIVLRDKSLVGCIVAFL